jgi:hypothetical protein
VVSEYGHCDVDTPIYINRALRQAEMLAVRPGPFGEQLETYHSRAFAVCDHQVAHVYVRDQVDIPRVEEILRSVDGIAQILSGEAREQVGLRHPRAGEIIALSQPKAWFAYPFWLDDRFAPDYARNVAIHAKPGYDPCELFFDPKITFPKLKVIRKVMQKKLGFRMKLDVIPLDASIVRGSHGLAAASHLDGPLLIGTGLKPPGRDLPMTAFKELLLAELELPPQ